MRNSKTNMLAVTPEQHGIKYRAEIDGLRAIAVVPVILFHAGIKYFRGGYLGVDVFFVISGYLISQILFREGAEGRFSLVNFYVRRFKRILPALAFVLLVTLPFALMWFLPGELKGLGSGLISIAGFSSNIYFWNTIDYFNPIAENSPILHTWSLSLEEQFYIFWPLVIMFFFKRNQSKALLKTTMLVTIASFLLFEWGRTASALACFYLLPFRAWELLAGSALAFYHVRESEAPSKWIAEALGWLGLVLVVAPFLIVQKGAAFLGPFTFLTVIGTCLLIHFARAKTQVGRLLCSSALVGTGLISYSLYLWHQPIFAIIRTLSGHEMSHRTLFFVVSTVFLISYLSWRFIESPVRRARISNRNVLSAGGGILMLLLFAGYFILKNDGFPQRIIQQGSNRQHYSDRFFTQLIALESGKQKNIPCLGSPTLSGVKVCTLGDQKKASSDLILYGDSLAGALAYGLGHELERRKMKLTVIVQDGCPPISELRNSIVSTCTEKTHELALQRIIELSSNAPVVLHGNLIGALLSGNCTVRNKPVSIEAEIKALEAFQKKLSDMGHRLYLLQQGPYFSEHVTDFYLRKILRGGDSEIAMATEKYRAFIEPYTRMGKSIRLIDSTSYFCGSTTCSPLKDGGLIVSDATHYTHEGSVGLARVVLSFLRL